MACINLNKGALNLVCLSPPPHLCKIGKLQIRIIEDHLTANILT